MNDWITSYNKKAIKTGIIIVIRGKEHNDPIVTISTKNKISL